MQSITGKVLKSKIKASLCCSHLCSVSAPISGKNMSRNGVNEVTNPDETQAQQEGFGNTPGPICSLRSHTFQHLEVEGTEEEC